MPCPTGSESGVKKVYNGAIAYTPDGNPIIGPAWDVPNFWLSEGHSFGITAAGGTGWQLAEWIVEGEPTIDMLASIRGAMAATGQSISRRRTKAENVIHYPDEERGAARPLHRAVL